MRSPINVILIFWIYFLVICVYLEDDFVAETTVSNGIYVLPRNFYPLQYHVKLALIADGSTFTGETTIDIVCKSNADTLIIHSSNLEIHSSDIVFTTNNNDALSTMNNRKIDGLNSPTNLNDSNARFIQSITTDKALYVVSSKRNQIGSDEMGNNFESTVGESNSSEETSFQVDDSKEILIFPLGKNVNSGEKLRLQIKYRGKFSNTLEGLYKTTYNGDKSGQSKTIIATHFEPIGARKAFPCFDEPIYKANFTISIVHDSNKKALSNSRVSSTTVDENHPGHIITEFYPTLKMSSYLVAFVVMDYVSMQLSLPNNRTISILAPYIYKNQLDLAANVTSKVLPFYERFFGEPYSLGKLDLIALPEFVSGAMENWGLITFRNIYMLYDKSRSSADNRKQIITVICHELAHQWFGNLVTMKWWDDIWLNEGFANYIELIGANYYDPSLKIMDQQIIGGWSSALEMDSMNNTRAISSTIYSATSIDEMFDVISYSKGAAILRMIHAFMGDDAFISGIKSYIQKFKYRNANTKDLWLQLNQFFPKANIKTIMDSWIEQKGFPLISVKTNSNSVKISQQSYLRSKANVINKRDDINPLEFLWYVPINYIHSESNGNISTVLLTPVADMELQLNPGVTWIKLNSGVTGFYVVNYDQKGWSDLIQQLTTNHTVFSPVDRAGLIHDAFKLTCDGILSPKVLFDLIGYMSKENDYLPWTTLRSKHHCLVDIIGKNEVSSLYKIYLWNLQKHLVDLNVLIQSSDPNQLLQQYEVALFALKYGTIPILKKTVSELFEFLLVKNLTGFKYPEIRTLSLLYGVEHKNDTQFRLIWQSYVNSFSDYDKKFLTKNLAAFTSPENTLINLNNVFNLEVVKIQDTLPFLLTLYKMCFNKNICWDYIENNWKKLIYKFPKEALSDFILSLVTATKEKDIILRIQIFLAKHSIEKNSYIGKQIEEKIALKTNDDLNKWKTRSFCEILEWIYTKKNKSPPLVHLNKCAKYFDIHFLNF